VYCLATPQPLAKGPCFIDSNLLETTRTLY
jgi:hypothetical protein